MLDKVGDFYGTGIEIWTGFGPIGITKKKDLGGLRATFQADIFKFSLTKKEKKRNQLKILYRQR